MNKLNQELEKIGFNFKLTIDKFKKDNKDEFETVKQTLSESDLKKIKFKEFEGNPPTEIHCENNSDGSCDKSVDLELSYTSDKTKYPNNMKFTFKNKNSFGGNKDIKLKRGDKSLGIFNLSSSKSGDDFKSTNGVLER